MAWRHQATLDEREGLGFILAVILDLHLRRSSLGGEQSHESASGDLGPKMAIAFRPHLRTASTTRNRDSTICSHDYQKILRQHGFKASMSGKGNCYPSHGSKHALPGQWTTPAVENLSNHQSAELIWRRSWETRRKAEHGRSFDNIRWLLQSRPQTPSTGLESPVALRTEGGLNEHLGRPRKREHTRSVIQ